MTCLSRNLLNVVADEILNDLIEERLKLRTGNKIARSIVALCMSGSQPLNSMLTVFSDYLEAEIGGGSIKIKLQRGVLMNKHPFLVPLYRVGIGKAFITLGDPGTPEYAENLRLVVAAQFLRHAIFYPGSIPAGGVKELCGIFPHLEILQCPINMIPADVNNAFPRLLNLTVDGSVPSILKFFDNAGNLPALTFFCLNAGGNVENFINNFVPGRLPRLKTFIMTAFHYADATFCNTDIFGRFADFFPKLKDASVTVIQTSVKFNPDHGFYLAMQNKFFEAEPNARLKLVVQHTPTTGPIRGRGFGHEDVRRALEPLGYFINKDRSGYCCAVGIADHDFTHHILVDLPPPVRVPRLTRGQ